MRARPAEAACRSPDEGTDAAERAPRSVTED
jgi:hypothetical protein